MGGGGEEGKGWVGGGVGDAGHGFSTERLRCGDGVKGGEEAKGHTQGPPGTVPPPAMGTWEGSTGN